MPDPWRGRGHGGASAPRRPQPRRAWLQGREIAALPTFPARSQKIDLGSFVRVDDEGGLLLAAGSFSVHAFIYPTTPERPDQVVLGRWSEEGGGQALALGPDGVELWVGDGKTKERVVTGTPLYGSCWYSIGATFNADSGEAFVSCVPLANSTNGLLGAAVVVPGAGDAEASLALGAPRLDLPFVVAASSGREGSFEQHYNGKVERPTVWDRPLRREELAGLAEDAAALPAEGLVASWDFAANIEGGALATDLVVDRGPHGLDGICRNGPARGMTGGSTGAGKSSPMSTPRSSTGRSTSTTTTSRTAGWETDSVDGPRRTCASGVYAAARSARRGGGRLPFFVLRPRGGAATADVVAASSRPRAIWPTPTSACRVEPDRRSAMCGHRCSRPAECISMRTLARRCPSMTLTATAAAAVYSSPAPDRQPARPTTGLAIGAPGFPADLHLVDWLEERAFAFDVVTDGAARRRRGAARSLPGRGTGTHPEYGSEEMLDAWRAISPDGGRAIYLGANGFYWVTASIRAKPH